MVPGLAYAPAPDALIVNDGGLTFARIRFDDRSLRALTACAMDVGDPLTEAVCWNAVWDMTTAAELSVAGFINLVVRRIGGGQPPGVAELLERAVTAADYYAVPAERPGLRRRTAAAALDAARRARPGSGPSARSPPASPPARRTKASSACCARGSTGRRCPVVWAPT